MVAKFWSIDREDGKHRLLPSNDNSQSLLCPQSPSCRVRCALLLASLQMKMVVSPQPHSRRWWSLILGAIVWPQHSGLAPPPRAASAASVASSSPQPLSAAAAGAPEATAPPSPRSACPPQGRPGDVPGGFSFSVYLPLSLGHFLFFFPPPWFLSSAVSPFLSECVFSARSSLRG